jgi:uncharacterized protein (TIGR00369 family)
VNEDKMAVHPLVEKVLAARPPIAELIGFIVQEIGAGRAVGSLQAGPEHANPMGALHGGILCDISDAAMGMAFVTTLAPDESFTTVTLSIQFFRPVWQTLLRAEARVVNHGKNVGYLECDVTDQDGRQVAKSRQVRPASSYAANRQRRVDRRREKPMGKLEGKVALVTGGNSGIGLATAKAFVNEGAFVFITGRRESELAAGLQEIGGHVAAVQGDVSNLGDLDRLFEQIKREKGRLDIVFANAGVAKYSPLGEITDEFYDSIFNVNVKGVLFTVQKALPLCHRRGGSTRCSRRRGVALAMR